MKGTSITCSQARRWLAMCVILLAPVVGYSAEPYEEFTMDPQILRDAASDPVHGMLMSHYSDWAGTRYRLGGSTKTGVDCSSFIQILFREKFSHDLPRMSREQMTVGEQVNMSDLRTGDLVFFRTGPTRKHVGVYVGDNKFMHVSARAGVKINKLLNPYWQRRFITARRVAPVALTPSN